MRTANLLRSVLLMVLATFLTIACSQPDSVMTAKIKARMATDTTVNSSQIEVVTDSKVVTLTGNLNTSADKERALEVARRRFGGCA